MLTLDKKMGGKSVFFALGFIIIIFQILTIRVSAEEYGQDAQKRMEMAVDSAQWNNWPSGPINGAEGAVLMDADSGAVLYAKNPDLKEYPASITKIMTALLTIENCDLDEQVIFSHNAVYSIERGSSNVGIDEGQSMTVRECLYCLLLASANEVANALAEHVSGSVEDFADLMNKRAGELGCTGTHFTNPNGLHDDNHYTTAADMARIAQAFFANEVLADMSGTVSYDITASANQPDSFQLMNHHRMLMGCLYGSRYSYEYTVGGKTGYTVIARETLVTCAQKNGMRLIAIIMKEEPHKQFSDSKDLFEYGFENFRTLPLEQVVTDSVRSGLQLTAEDILTEGGAVTIPNRIDEEELEFSLSDLADEENARQILCCYGDRILGTGRVEHLVQEEVQEPVLLPEEEIESLPMEPEEKTRSFGILGKILKLLLIVIVVLIVIGIGAIMMIRGYIRKERERARRARALQERARRRREQWAREDALRVEEED